MKNNVHDFHIPVMGTAFTIDSPYKVAKFGISSVVSIGDDELCENMRKYYSELHGYDYSEISKENDIDYRAKRITAYLDLLDDLISNQINTIKQQSFDDENSDAVKYFEMLMDGHPLKNQFNEMLSATGDKRTSLEIALKDAIRPGAIDVNIMTKLDRTNFDKDKNPLPDEYSDAVSALRGFANSKIKAGIVFSAGFNRRLFAHCDKVDDFYYNNGFKKEIILKVSDYRSSLIQGRFLAKKGVWVSEYRIESGLNCGGHAFASDGLLCGPILQEFKDNKKVLDDECRSICNEVLVKNGHAELPESVQSRVTYQGGIGTSNEQQFLMNFYDLATTGWATPFLLVPEVTTLDMATRLLLKDTTQADCYLSGVSPLGVPFNTVRGTDSEKQKLDRVENGRPGSPCPKGHLIFDTEFTKKPICKASVLYQKRKIEQLKKLDLVSSEYEDEFTKIIDKGCLCEDLAAPALIEYGIENNRPLKSTVCAGPNIAYYRKIVTLKEMIGHIYGRLNLIDDQNRPSLFVAELNMYVKYLKNEVKILSATMTNIDIKRMSKFAQNMFDGIRYYMDLIKEMKNETDSYKQRMMNEFEQSKKDIEHIIEENKELFSQIVAPAFA